MSFKKDKHVSFNTSSLGEHFQAKMMRYDVRASGVVPSNGPFTEFLAHIFSNVIMNFNGITFGEIADGMIRTLSKLYFEMEEHGAPEDKVIRARRIIEVFRNQIDSKTDMHGSTTNVDGVPLKGIQRQLDHRSLREKYDFLEEDLDHEGLEELDKYIEPFKYD